MHLTWVLCLAAALASGCSRSETAASSGEPAASPAAPEAPAFDAAAFTARVDALAAEALEKGPVAGLSIGVARGRDVVLAKGYGHADREGGLPASADSSYPVASVSKMFTAAAILQLAEQGKLSLDDPLSRVLPEATGKAGQVAIRHYLTHTSGLAARPGPSPRSRAERALRAGVVVEPGTDFEYSNAGFAVLGLVVERASGMKYADYVAQMASTLGLPSTGYCEARVPVPNRVRDYGLSAKGLLPTTYWHYEKFFAAGGLCSSVNDLLKWMRALQDGKVLHEASLRAMRTPATMPGGVEIGYGLGTRMGETDRHRKLGHTGGGTSNKAVVAHYPEADTTIVVLLNTEAGRARVTAMELEDKVARALFGLPEEPSRDVKLPMDQLRRYTGRYNELGRTTRVALQEAEQQLTAAGLGPLLPQGGDAFVDADDPGVSLRFVTSGDSVVGYLRGHQGWFVEYGRREGDAGPEPPPRKPARRRSSRRAAPR